ncbi:alpha-N-arabinofuranosidase [Streptomyces sp. NBC_01314]|uniref:arabinosylfuranosidase ArfA n=1 Tax=Streptomyces sp. NBC_01314 TaxID=2903821 RepID=UPI00308F77EA|nr:alpha-N-arabinofuranosidase [Streptomyces sp. NBC_01314]
MSSPRPARFTLDPAFGIGAVNPRIYGSFVEHLGRCVYDGIHEPGHPDADEAGLREDVLALIRELGVTTVRYPGGNFVSGYRWEDSVGPVDERPRRLEPAWRSTETNRFGLAEFMDFCAKSGIEPMMAVNLGTRGVEDAGRLLDYANHPGGTELSDLRAAHGSKEPFGIRMWCLGNEMDGPWQIGHKTAQEYAPLARETANLMKQIDPGLELVLCGSSSFAMPTFGSWESTVLTECYDKVEFISLHTYYGLDREKPDLDSFIASAVDMERYIEAAVATCDHVGATLKSDKKIMISFDEWNVWHSEPVSPPPSRAENDWPQAPRLLENSYTLTDSVLVGSLMIALLRHADRVTSASLAQLVNVIAPIMTEPGGPAWRQTTFFPFAQASRYGRGRVLRVEVDSPTHSTERFGEVDLLHATATHDEEAGTITVFAVNRSRTAELPLEVDLRGLGGVRVVEHLLLTDDDPDARNTLTDPERVAPRTVDASCVTGDVLTSTLPPLSWNVIRLAVTTAQN